MNTTSSILCKICGSACYQQDISAVPELMNQTYKESNYVYCKSCGTYHIISSSDDKDLYDSSYYSHRASHSSTLKNLIVLIRDSFTLFAPSLVFHLLCFFPIRKDLAALRYLRPPKDSRILDIGCGNGSLLFALRRLGFTNLYGIDPYSKSLSEHCITIKNHASELLENQFDIIIFNHSLEHVPNPIKVLRESARLLSSSGKVLIRVPLIPNLPFLLYGFMWYQFDSPRHRTIFSFNSLRHLISSTDLNISHFYYDSNVTQFTISMGYMRGEKLFSKSYHKPVKYGFPIRVALSVVIHILNYLYIGDQICVVASKK